MAFKNLNIPASQLTAAEVAFVQALAALTKTKGNIFAANGTTWTALGVSGNNGYVLSENSGASSGLQWVVAGSGITSLGGLTAATQTFATGTTGADFGISSATSTHTFNLPTASGTNRGALSSSDWTTFNGKQDALSSVSNVPANTVLLNASPTVGAFAEGKFYYDATWKTVSFNNDTNITLKIGQDELRFVYNNTGSTISAGEAVYTNGVYSAGSNDVVTVAKARADSTTTAFVLGVATQDILTANYGFITVRGHVNNINTNAAGWTAGDVLYLDAVTAGALTNVVPDAPNLKIRVGRLITKSATVGRINIRLAQIYGLGDLSDVTLSTPALDQVLRYNGVSWINGSPVSSSASIGISFFQATPSITATGANNDIEILTLSKTPITTTEQVKTVTVGNATIPMSAWIYDTALGRTSIDAGIWSFHTYAACSSIIGGRISSITRQVYSVLTQDGGSHTVTITGSGTSRTADSSGGTPFATTKIDASATNTAASYLQTPLGLFQITARASDTEVTITTPSGYSNESTVAFKVWKKLFGTTTSTITTTGTNYIDYPTTVAQSAFTITVNHKLGSITFGTSNTAGVTITTTYNGTTHNTSFTTPLITLHDNLAGLQGGTTGEYYHLTSAEYTGSGTGNFARITSPALVTPNIGTPTAGTLTSCTGLPAAGVVNTAVTLSDNQTITGLKTFGTTGAIKLGSAVTDKCEIRFNDSALNDETWSGIVLNAVAGATLAVGDVCYLKTSDSQWYLNDGILDGTDSGFKLKLGICVLAANDNDATKILLDGLIASAAFPTFTVGAPVYLDDTAGDLVVAQPTTTNFAIRVVGEAVTATVLHFHPSNDYIVHV